MGFADKDVTDLLVHCHRRCCVCHRFCGVKMETHHMDEGAGDAIDNAIAVCFDCHAEIRLYNPQHPRGRSFKSAELKRHRDQWLEICRNHPEIFASSPVVAPPGTMGALDQEIEFNLEVADHSGIGEVGCPFSVIQFDRAVADGTYSVLDEKLRGKLREAYRLAKLANTLIASMSSLEHGSSAGPHNRAQNAVAAALKPFSDLKRLIEAPFDSADVDAGAKDRQ